MALFEALPVSEKNKIHFIHFNHTNRLMIKECDEFKNVLKSGFKVSEFGQQIAL